MKALLYIKKITKRLLQLSVIAFLIYLIYFFYQPGIDVKWFYIPNPIFEFTQSISWKLYIIVYTIIVCFINIIVFSSLSFFYDYHRNRDKRKRKKFEDLFAEKIVNYLFDDSNSTKPEDFINELKPILKSKRRLASFFRVTKTIKETIELENINDKLIFIVDGLNLRRRLNNFLFCCGLNEKILALEIISYLELKDYNKEILKFIDNKNHALSSEAIASIIRMSDFNYLFDVINKDKLLSLFDINLIVNALLENKKVEIDFGKLLSSPYPSVVTIGVIIARFKGAFQFKEEIKKLIGDKDQLLNLAAWSTYLEFAEEKDSLDLILEKYEYETIRAKKLILKKSSHFTSEKHFDFLKTVIKEGVLIEKVAAMKTSFEYNFNSLLEFYNSDDLKIQKAYQEVIDFHNIN